MALCAERGRFLFEARPDVFGAYLSELELALWGKWYDEKARERKG